MNEPKDISGMWMPINEYLLYKEMLEKREEEIVKRIVWGIEPPKTE